MTIQVMERLLYQGSCYDMIDEPLQAYLGRLGSKAPKFEERSTSCHRGYTGTWKIVEGKLFLIDLRGELENGKHVGLSTFFPYRKWMIIQFGKACFSYLRELLTFKRKAVSRRPFTLRRGVFAEWFSGDLLAYCEMGPDHLPDGGTCFHERQLHVVVKCGLVQSCEVSEVSSSYPMIRRR